MTNFDKELSKVDKIQQILRHYHYQVYLVGGAVRDILLNKEPKDLDLVTSATPAQIGMLFEKAKTCGNNFQVSIISGIEVATFRKDFNDFAVPASSLEEDVQRRDFTINAIAMQLPDLTVVDYVDGVNDLNNKILRFIGNPEQRILEDPVRILRGIRFASTMGLTIEPNTLQAMLVHRNKLLDIPKERIRLEIIKALKTKNGYQFLKMLQEFELLFKFFSHLKNLQKYGGKYHNEEVLTHSLLAVRAIDTIGSYKQKLACLYHDIGKQTEVINPKGEVIFRGHDKNNSEDLVEDLRALTFTNEEIHFIKALKELHMSTILLDDGSLNVKAVRKLNAKLLRNKLTLRDFIILRYADNRSNLSRVTDAKDYLRMYRGMLRAVKENKVFSLKSLKINGKDIIRELHLAPSPEIDRILNTLFTEVVDGKLKNTEEDLIERAKEIKVNKVEKYSK